MIELPQSWADSSTLHFLLKADIYNDKWIGNQFYRKTYINLN